MCNLCDMYEVEDARHFILRCPYFTQMRNVMLREIEALNEGNQAFFDDDVDMLYRLLGRPHGDVSEVQTEMSLLVILKSVSTMYKENMKQKKGVG